MKYLKCWQKKERTNLDFYWLWNYPSKVKGEGVSKGWNRKTLSSPPFMVHTKITTIYRTAINEKEQGSTVGGNVN